MMFEWIFYDLLNNNLVNHLTGWTCANLLPKIKEMIAINFIRMLRAGPEVSFNGSPTVSPTTAALWTSEPFK